MSVPSPPFPRRFSGSLTKDVVFSGTRDLFQRLGRVVASGQHAEFDIGVGKVIAKERKVTCHFDASMRDMVAAVSRTPHPHPPPLVVASYYCLVLMTCVLWVRVAWTHVWVLRLLARSATRCR